ncbi:hypothetical protein NQ317_013865, partial [Molorchus minor]
MSELRSHRITLDAIYGGRRGKTDYYYGVGTSLRFELVKNIPMMKVQFGTHCAYTSIALKCFIEHQRGYRCRSHGGQVLILKFDRCLPPNSIPGYDT